MAFGSQTLLAGTSTILHDVKTLMSMPYIGLPKQASLNAVWRSSVIGMLTTIGAFRGMPIFASSHVETGNNNIGTQVVVSNSADSINGASIVTDNVVTEPRQFSVDGYISLQSLGDSINAVLSMFGASPVAGNTVTILTHVTNQTVLNLCKMYIRWIRTQRAPFSYTLPSGETILALIKSYKFSDDPTVSNVCPIHLDIAEYCALSNVFDPTATKIAVQTIPANNAPSVGSVFNSASKIGGLFASNIATFIPSMFSFGSVNRQDSSEDVTSSSANSAETDDTTEVLEDGSTAAVLDEESLNAIAGVAGLDATEFINSLSGFNKTYVAVANSLFSGSVTTDEEGNQVYIDHIEMSLSFSGGTVSLEVSKGYANLWTISQKGTVNGEEISYNDTLTFNSVYHANATFAFMLVSAYLPFNEDKTFYDLNDQQKHECLADCGLVLIW